MAWERSIDRLLLRQIHLAERGDLQDGEVRSMILDQLELTREHPRTWFHAGYARTYLGLDLPEPSANGEGLRWYHFGRFRAHFRKGETHWMADLVEDEGILLDLMREPAIAAQILPSLMDLFFKEFQYEKAVWILGLLEGEIGDGGKRTELRILLEAALSDLLTRLERSPIPAEHKGSVRRALKAAMETHAHAGLTGGEQARFLLALGRSLVTTGEWDEARRQLDAALALLEEPENRIRRHVLLQLALCALRLLDLTQLAPEPERDAAARETALDCLDRSLEGGALAETCYARGILLYETGAFEAAAGELEAGAGLFREAAAPDETLFARCRFYLGASLLAGGDRGELHKGVRNIEETLDLVRPDLETFYPIYDALKQSHQKVALRFLDCLDLGRGTTADSLLLVALEYQALGEPARALEAAERVLTITQDLDQRIEAMKVRLGGHNMQGSQEEARRDYLELRDQLHQRGAFAELEILLQDEGLVGQALDHVEIKCELADLYEEMEGREWDRANLQLQIARSMKARKEVEDLGQAMAILREVEIGHPDLARDELQALEKLLALRGADEEPVPLGEEQRVFKDLAKALGRPVRLLVVGGNERQRKHHTKLWSLAEAWGFEAEWLMANYQSPQKTVAQIGDRLKGGQVDLLLLLHWNRHETTEPALEQARAAGVPARTVFYAGFTSLQVGLVEMARRSLTQART
ncbi:MAG: hypothetical protein R3F30_10820 [Planctomycetota bacterium]